MCNMSLIIYFWCINNHIEANFSLIQTILSMTSLCTWACVSLRQQLEVEVLGQRACTDLLAIDKLFSYKNFQIDSITSKIWILLPYKCHQTLICTNLKTVNCSLSSHFTKILFLSHRLLEIYYTITCSNWMIWVCMICKPQLIYFRVISKCPPEN